MIFSYSGENHGPFPKKIKAETCVNILQEEFTKFPDPRSKEGFISLHDFLMSSYAIFALKYPSLLNFERSMLEDQRKANLKSLFGIENVPSDTHLRDIMDQIPWQNFRIIFKKLFATVQDSKILEKFEFMRIKNRPHYLLNIDGTGYFRSDNINCECCLKYEGTDKRKLPSLSSCMRASEDLNSQSFISFH